MKYTLPVKHYSQLEEPLNIASHGLGLCLGIVALVLLLTHAASNSNALEIVSFAIFGSSLVVTYGISTLYHSVVAPPWRHRMRVLDHASIYILIAGTYTPFALIILQGPIGWTLFGVSWGLAAAGITVKLFLTGRFEAISTVMYVLMGWMILFVIGPLIDNMHPVGLRWLVAGGLAYTIGAGLYGLRRIPLNHALFHTFTLIGSFCHFVAVYWYII